MTLEEAKAKLEAAGCLATPPTAWTIETAKNLEKDGPYADYAAWETWIGRLCDEPCSDESGDCVKAGHSKCCNCRMFDWWENIEFDEKAQLYGLFCAAVIPPTSDVPHSA